MRNEARINAGYARIESWDELGGKIVIHPRIILLLRMPLSSK